MGETVILAGREGSPRWERPLSEMGERVLRDGMDRYPCWEKGFSEMGWTVILAGRKGSPRWDRALSLLGERGIQYWYEGAPRRNLRRMGVACFRMCGKWGFCGWGRRELGVG
jgi:hypothetical protein